MKRQLVSTYNWFNIDEAYVYQAKWETLYLTQQNNWVLHDHAKYSSDITKWDKLNRVEAAFWLIKNDYDLPIALVEPIKMYEL